MSIRVMSHVWANSGQQGSNLLVLLAIADWARDDGHNAYPTIPMLAAKARLSTRSVQRIIAKLEHTGELVIRRSTGRGHAHVYSIPMDTKGDNLSSDKDVIPSVDDISDASVKGDNGGMERVTSETERVTSDAIKGDIPRITNRQVTVNKPSIKPLASSISKKLEYPDWFQPLANLKGFKARNHLNAITAIRDGCDEAGVNEAQVVQQFADYYRDGGRASNGWLDPVAALVRTLPVQISKLRRPNNGSAPPPNAVNRPDFAALKAAQDARRGCT